MLSLLIDFVLTNKELGMKDILPVFTLVIERTG